jgi:ferredoxin--NADP+ reductase
MAGLRTERVLSVNHWSDRLFSFKTTRDPNFRFESGHFVMLGIELGGKPLMRAFSIASPYYCDVLEFLSIKVPGGPLTSQLQYIAPGRELIVSNKPVGTLVVRDLRPGRTLYLLATGTGLAPFMSIIQDPETYEKFERVVLAHGVRTRQELAYAEYITEALPHDPFLGETVAAKLLYYPTVTREPYRNMGRLTHLMASAKLSSDLGLSSPDPQFDRAMICGSAQMLADMSALLDARGFEISAGTGVLGDYVIERAFAEK